MKQSPMARAKEYNNRNVYYPYHYPDSAFIRTQHETFNIVIPQSPSEKSLCFYTSHNDLQHILQRRELHGIQMNGNLHLTLSWYSELGYKYQFTLRNTDTRSDVTHSVLWDYETGHVRISPMFKSSEYEYLRRKVRCRWLISLISLAPPDDPDYCVIDLISKSQNTPRKWVDRNNLHNCYASTTGGRIEAQGKRLYT